MDKQRETEYLNWLCHVPFFGAVTIRSLYEKVGSFEMIYNIEGRQLQKLYGVSEKAVTEFEKYKKTLDDTRREMEELDKRKIRFITPFDKEYPTRLLHLPDYPMGLYVKGKLPCEDQPAAAVIGARACTEYGRQTAMWISGELAKMGIQMISGLASGIDGACHRGTLEAEGDTYGVLGCGINICYPKENYYLFEKMGEKGGILTEFNPKEEPRPQNFPMRNRIISGLSDVILIIEAREKSGSLITASLGLEQGKEIFALPGRITDPLSIGCNRLIAEGAAVLTGPESVLEYLEIQSGKLLRVHKINNYGLAKKEKMVYSCLDLQPKGLEEIVRTSGLSVNQCMNILLELELKGLVVQTSCQYYGKKL